MKSEISIRDTKNELPEDKDVEIILNDYNKDFCNEFMNMPYDKRIFKNNINSIVYKETPDEEMGKDYASYRPLENVIKYKKDEYKNSIYHELLHASSTFVKGDLTCSGFMQKNGKSLIGIGITEGFTCFFDDKYFAKYRKDPDSLQYSYSISKNLISYFNHFITIEEMAEYYFKADLYGLIMRLSRYVDPRRVVRMLLAFDGIYKYEVGFEKCIFDAMHYYDYVTNFLVEYNLNVLNDAYFKKKVSKETYMELLEQIRELTYNKIYAIRIPFLRTLHMSNRRFKHFNDNSKRYVLSKLNK